MKKILGSVLIILLLVLAYFIIFEGMVLGDVQVLSVEQIMDANDSLTAKIEETNSLQKKDYVEKKEDLSGAVTELLKQKETYFNLAKVSTTGELAKANTQTVYAQEYLWTRIGRHATSRGVDLYMEQSTSNAGDSTVKNISFRVIGYCPGIADFLYAIEEDSELNFRIEGFTLGPNGSGSTLVATFHVNNVRVKDEKTTKTPSTSSEADTQ